MAGHPRNGGTADRRDNQPDEYWNDDGRSETEHPRQTEEQCGDADEQPRGDAEIAEPARYREDRRELLQLVGVELHDNFAVVGRRQGCDSGCDVLLRRRGVTPEFEKPHRRVVTFAAASSASTVRVFDLDG